MKIYKMTDNKKNQDEWGWHINETDDWKTVEEKIFLKTYDYF